MDTVSVRAMEVHSLYAESRIVARDLVAEGELEHNCRALPRRQAVVQDVIVVAPAQVDRRYHRIDLITGHVVVTTAIEQDTAVAGDDVACNPRRRAVANENSGDVALHRVGTDLDGARGEERDSFAAGDDHVVGEVRAGCAGEDDTSCDVAVAQEVSTARQKNAAPLLPNEIALVDRPAPGCRGKAEREASRSHPEVGKLPLGTACDVDPDLSVTDLEAADPDAVAPCHQQPAAKAADRAP